MHATKNVPPWRWAGWPVVLLDCGPARLGAEYGGGGNRAKERLGLGMKEAGGEGRGLAGKFAFVEIRTTDG